MTIESPFENRFCFGCFERLPYEKNWGRPKEYCLPCKKRNAYFLNLKWKKANRSKILSMHRAKMKKSPEYRIHQALGATLRRHLKKNQVLKNQRIEQILGYSMLELKLHLESKFKEGMSWSNYPAWHIDHIKPKSLFKFNSVTDEEFKRCWSLSNLQPLWAKENMKKHNKYVLVESVL